MKTELILRRLKLIIDEYPAGSIVYHRANGARGVIVEWCVDGTGCVLICVDYGRGSWEKELPTSLSAERISPDSDGESWKEHKE